MNTRVDCVKLEFLLLQLARDVSVPVADAGFRCFVAAASFSADLEVAFGSDWSRLAECWLEAGRLSEPFVFAVVADGWTEASEAAASVNFASRELSSATSLTFDTSLPGDGVVFLVWLAVSMALCDAESPWSLLPILPLPWPLLPVLPVPTTVMPPPFFTAVAGNVPSPVTGFDAASLPWNVTKT